MTQSATQGMINHVKSFFFLLVQSMSNERVSNAGSNVTMAFRKVQD
jgi:hypothetical protein